MQLIRLDQVAIGPRQRRKIDPGPLTELSEDIAKLGLLHPPVVVPDNTRPEIDGYVIIVGERRYRAIKRLADAGRRYTHNNTVVEPGWIPVTLLSELLDPSERFEAELSENIHRVDIPWQDKTDALAKLHALRQSQNPKQTATDTAVELVERRGGVVSATAKTSAQPALTSTITQIHQAAVIARHLSNPKIAGARSATEAYNQVLKMEEDAFRAALARRQLAELPRDTRPLIEVRHGDLLTVLPGMEANTIDLILADPPYGIGASGGGFRSRTVHHHDYDDTPENAKQLARAILVEGFRLCKPRANLFLFTDLRLWNWLQETAAQLGWSPFPRPGIWIKSQVEGLAPWGSQGFRIGTEFFLFATKGGKGLHASPMDTFSFSRVARDEREHGAEKPDGLLRRLIECSTLPGNLVLDPCCGSGSTLVACAATRRRAIGIERDADYFNIAFKNAHSATPTSAPGGSDATVPAPAP